MPAIFAWFFLGVRGRISRQEYWLGMVLTVLVLWLLGPRLEDLSIALFRPRRATWYLDELTFALIVPKLLLAGIAIWPIVAVVAKRLHDLGLSAWWLLAPGLAVLATASQMDRWHISARVVMVVIGLVPGRRGDNRFGADPLARDPSSR